MGLGDVRDGIGEWPERAFAGRRTTLRYNDSHQIISVNLKLDFEHVLGYTMLIMYISKLEPYRLSACRIDGLSISV